MSSALFFVYALLALFMAFNAIRPASPPTARLPALWLPAVLVAEAPVMWLIARALITVLFLLLGALERPIGWVALGVVAVAQALQLELIRRAGVSARQIGAGDTRAAWWERLTGWPYRLPDEVERLAGIEFVPGLTLDLYRPHPSAEERLPCLVYVHGGSWGGGDPRRVFRHVVHHLVRNGWAVATIRYPLSPVATFPDHLVGVKRGLHWVRTQGSVFGLDGRRVAIAGGSAGAHLASLAALTVGRHQPDFEQADTSVRAVVVLYGIYDFLNRHRTRFDWPLIPHRVMKADPTAAPDLYREASPIDQVGPHAPPFLVIHGESDSLVPIGEAEHFVAALDREGNRVDFVRVRWGQHAFDIMAGARTRALATLITAFLTVEVRPLPSDTDAPGTA